MPVQLPSSIKSNMSALKKCIVLDLDNTLWGGVIGEDGMDGIALSLTEPGASFIAFQQALLDLYNRGVILAINSQNNPEDALEVIRTHPNMILKESHFAATRINWQDKVTNLQELARELNIGLDSMVFFDDNPINRAAVRSFLPEVEVPELTEDPSTYAALLLSLPYFPTEATTNEDMMRSNLYVTERLRREAEKAHASKEDFLKSLRLELTVTKDDPTSLARLSQLTEKTNQFNTNKKILSEAEVERYIQDPNYHVFSGRLTDRFGDYGITTFALVHKKDDIWHIESMLMSCRVFGRGVEHAYLAAIAHHAMKEGAPTITASFVPTEKNLPAKEFLETTFADSPLATNMVSSPTWIILSL